MWGLWASVPSHQAGIMPLERLKGPALAWGRRVGHFIKGSCLFISKVFDLEG